MIYAIIIMITIYLFDRNGCLAVRVVWKADKDVRVTAPRGAVRFRLQSSAGGDRIEKKLRPLPLQPRKWSRSARLRPKTVFNS